MVQLGKVDEERAAPFQGLAERPQLQRGSGQLALRQTWVRDLVECHWLYEGLSRGRARVCVFMEDLSLSIRLPPGDL